jgi:CheY-like chemotaxis protein
VRGYTGPRRTILLADDDPAHLDLIRELLARWASPSCWRPTATPAWKWRRCKPDLVLLDISLPDMTGWQVAEALRQTEEAERGPGPWSEESATHVLKIIIVSANAHEYQPGGDGASPHDGFIMKPVELETLLTQIGELLQLQWVHEPAPAPRRLTQAAEPLPEMSGASLQHLDALYQLGRIGHVRGIEAKLREIEQQDEATSLRWRPTCEH